MLNSGCCREGHTSGTFQILKVVGIYICIYIYICLYLSLSLSLFIHTHTHTHTHTHILYTYQILKVVGALPQAETVHLCLEHCLVHTTTGAGADAQWQRCMYEYIYKYMKYMNYHLYEKPPELALMLNGSAVCKAAIQSSQIHICMAALYARQPSSQVIRSSLC